MTGRACFTVEMLTYQVELVGGYSEDQNDYSHSSQSGAPTQSSGLSPRPMLCSSASVVVFGYQLMLAGDFNKRDILDVVEVMDAISNLQWSSIESTICL